MSYEGKILHVCPADLDFSYTSLVVVSGQTVNGKTVNPCGHMLLCCGMDSSSSWYFHVIGDTPDEAYGIFGYPKFLHGDADYNRFLSACGKHEIRRIDVKISNPGGAYRKLVESMTKRWAWGGLIHNCANFAQEIVVAGGGSASIPYNCPDQDTVQHTKKLLEPFGKAIKDSGRGFHPFSH